MKKNNDKEYIIFGIIGFILVVYFSLYTGAYAVRNEDFNLFLYLQELPTLIKTNPFDIKPLNYSYLSFTVPIYILVLLSLFNSYKMNKKTMQGKEYGTAEFMTDKEVLKFTKKFMSKQKYTEGIYVDKIHNEVDK